MISDNNKQISVVIPIEIYNKIKADADNELRTVSKQVAKIVIDYFKEESK